MGVVGPAVQRGGGLFPPLWHAPLAWHRPDRKITTHWYPWWIFLYIRAVVIIGWLCWQFGSNFEYFNCQSNFWRVRCGGLGWMNLMHSTTVPWHRLGLWMARSSLFQRKTMGGWSVEHTVMVNTLIETISDYSRYNELVLPWHYLLWENY